MQKQEKKKKNPNQTTNKQNTHPTKNPTPQQPNQTKKIKGHKKSERERERERESWFRFFGLGAFPGEGEGGGGGGALSSEKPVPFLLPSVYLDVPRLRLALQTITCIPVYKITDTSRWISGKVNLFAVQVLSILTWPHWIQPVLDRQVIVDCCLPLAKYRWELKDKSNCFLHVSF